MDALPPGLPGVGNAANYGAEHESGDEGEEQKVDEAFQSIVAQPRHGLDVVLPHEHIKVSTQGSGTSRL